MAGASEQRDRLVRSLRLVERLARTCVECGETLSQTTLRAALDDIAIYAGRSASEAENVIPLVRADG